jgi:hypothetical protein
MLDIGRLKVQLDAHKTMISISDLIKQIRNIIDTFVMMLRSFLASSSDAVPCVRKAKTSLRLLERPSAFCFNSERWASDLPHDDVSAAGCPSGM